MFTWRCPRSSTDLATSVWRTVVAVSMSRLIVQLTCLTSLDLLPSLHVTEVWITWRHQSLQNCSCHAAQQQQPNHHPWHRPNCAPSDVDESRWWLIGGCSVTETVGNDSAKMRWLHRLHTTMLSAVHLPLTLIEQVDRYENNEWKYTDHVDPTSKTLIWHLVSHCSV